MDNKRADTYTVIKENKILLILKTAEWTLWSLKTDISIMKESYNNKYVEHIKQVEKQYKIEICKKQVFIQRTL